jgi:hypothetical protein
MARRKIVTIKEIYKLRGEAWAFHYANREAVRAIGNHYEAERIFGQLASCYPAPEMGIDGNLLDYPIDLRREYSHGSILPDLLSRLLCVWYWSESSWMDFVYLYQSLPEIYEDYYWRYQPEPFDRQVLFPVSTNGPRGRSYRVLITPSPKVHLSYRPVGKPVDNMAVFTSPKVHLAVIR